MSVRIKICGITNEKDGLAAARLGADALGFVFAPSPRRVAPERARQIIEVLPPLVHTVGVFVNEEKEKVSSIVDMCKLDIVQFHGNESVDYCKSFTLKVIKAVRLRAQDDLHSLDKYSGVVRALLLDSYVPHKVGGTGVTFNWELAVEAKRYGPIVLAGGLNPENIGSAIRKVKPYGVDASSGLEQSPGVKDHEKIMQFIAEVRRAGSY